MKTELLNQYPNIQMARPLNLEEPTKNKALADDDNLQEDDTLNFDASKSLGASLGIKDDASTNSSQSEITIGDIEPENVLETVRKRQAGQGIETSDVLADFEKTLRMLVTDAESIQFYQPYFNVLSSESQRTEVNVPLIKQLLKQMAKNLDEKVASSLNEPSTVVSDWLEALFTQPITWNSTSYGINVGSTLVRSSQQSETLMQSSPDKPASTGLTVPKAPIVPLRLKHLYIKDELESVQRVLGLGNIHQAVERVAKTVNYIKSDERLSAYLSQWERLQLKLLSKCSMHNELLEAYDTSSLKQDASLDLAINVANSHAELGNLNQGIKHLYASLKQNTSQHNEELNVRGWNMLVEMARKTQSISLEKRLLGELNQLTNQKLSNHAVAVLMPKLNRYQHLLEYSGQIKEAMAIAKTQVKFANQLKDKASYTRILRDVMALTLRSGSEKQTQAVMKLLAKAN